MVRRAQANITVLALLVVAAAVCVGCTGSAKLRHPTSKQEVTCGPYALKFGMGL